MTIGPLMQRCATCGEQWWESHCCPKQNPPMTVDGFFAEAKRLNLRMLGTPDETRATLGLKDAEIDRLRGELVEWNKLRNPATLHANLLRGIPCRLDRATFLHLAGDETPNDSITGLGRKE